MVYQWVKKIDLIIVTSVVDKPETLKRYGKKAFYPSTIAYLILMQRYYRYLEENKFRGEVIFYYVSGKTLAGYEWKKLLMKHHKRLQKKGCPITGIKFLYLKGDRIK